MKKQGRGGIDTGLIVVVIGGVAIAYFGLTGGLGSLGGIFGGALDLFGLGAGTAAGSKILGSRKGNNDDKNDSSSSGSSSPGSSGSSSGGGGDDFSGVTDPFSSPDLSKISPATPADLPKEKKPTTKSTRPAKSDSKAKKQVNAPANTKKADKPCEWYDIVCNAQKLLFGSPTINPALSPKIPLLA